MIRPLLFLVLLLTAAAQAQQSAGQVTGFTGGSLDVSVSGKAVAVRIDRDGISAVHTLSPHEWSQLIDGYNRAITRSAQLTGSTEEKIAYVRGTTVVVCAYRDGQKRWVGIWCDAPDGGRKVELDGAGCRQFNSIVAKTNDLLNR